MALRAVAARRSTTIGTVVPGAPAPGDLWWNLDDVKLYLWDGAEWVVTVNTPAAAPAYAALDTRNGSAPAGITDPFAAVRMAEGQIIDFNGYTGASLLDDHSANRYLQYVTTGTPRLRYMNAATELWSISDAGLNTADAIIANGAMTAQNPAAGWSNSNVGKQLLVTGGGNPAVGITDSSGANIWGIVNYGTTYGLCFNAMPALTDGTTAGHTVLALLPTGVTMNNGVSFGSTAASNPSDLSHHIALYGTTVGFNYDGFNVNYDNAAGGSHVWNVGASQTGYINTSGLTVAGGLGVHGTAAPAAKPTVTGSKGANAALASLLVALVSYGLVTDSTTA